MAVYRATATFTNAQDSVNVPIVGITTNPPIVVGGDPVIIDTSGPPIISLSAVSNTSVTVNTSGRFNGSVTLLVMD